MNKRHIYMDASKLFHQKVSDLLLHLILIAIKNCQQDIKYCKTFLKAFLLIKTSKVILLKNFKILPAHKKLKIVTLIGMMIMIYLKKLKKNIGI